jgi:hypothetical protein
MADSQKHAWLDGFLQGMVFCAVEEHAHDIEPRPFPDARALEIMDEHRAEIDKLYGARIRWNPR